MSSVFGRSGFGAVSIALSLLFGAVLVSAQTPERARNLEPLTTSSARSPISFGGYAGIALSTLRSSFAVDSSGFIEQGECGLFEDGSGEGIIIGGSFNFAPLPGYRIAIQPEFHLDRSTLSYRCVDPARIRMRDGSVVAAETIFKTELATRSLALRMLLVSTPFAIPLDFSVGPVLSLPLGGTYETWEEISTPLEAEFVSGGQSRGISSGDLPASAGPSIAVGGGVSYRARIGRSLELVPEIGYSIDLGTHHAPLDLSERALRVTLGVHYTPPLEAPIVAPPPVVPPPSPVALRAALALDAITPDGRSGDTLEYALHRTVSTRLHPLLTYLFFDERSDELPSRYRRRTAEQIAGFVEEGIESASVLETYHNVLDIVGARLRSHPRASVTVTGTQPDESDPELKLARRRADRVAGYLMENWKIAPARIRIATRAKPATVSNEETVDGREENRRVEIVSDTYEIMAPVLLADTTATSFVSGVRLAPSTPDSARVATWRLDLLRDGQVVDSRTGAGAPPKEIRRPELRLLNTRGNRLDELEGVLTIRDAAGSEAVARDRIAVRHREESDTMDYGSGQYSLILFDFGRADLRPEHRRIVDLINSRTPSGSKSTVAGFTDRLGEAALNLDLSRQRATTVARTLTGTIEKVIGEGEERLLYDNDLPEGRFYSRCVTVEVKTE